MSRDMASRRVASKCRVTSHVWPSVGSQSLIATPRGSLLLHCEKVFSLEEKKIMMKISSSPLDEIDSETDDTFVN